MARDELDLYEDEAPDYLDSDLTDANRGRPLQAEERTQAVSLLDDGPEAQANEGVREDLEMEVQSIIDRKDLTTAERIELIEGAAAENPDHELNRQIAFMKSKLDEKAIDSRQDFLSDIASVRDRRRRNAEIVVGVREEIRQGRDEGWSLDNLGKIAAMINPLDAARMAATGTGPDRSVAEDFLVSDFYPRVGMVLQDHVNEPGLGADIASMASPKAQVERLREQLLTIEDPEELKGVLGEIRQDIEDAGWVTDGDAQAQQMLDLFFGGIEYGRGVSSAENVFAAIEMAGLGMSAVGGAAKMFKAARKGVRLFNGAELSDDLAGDLGLIDVPAFRPGSAADVAADTPKGARRLVEGLEDPQRLEGTGVSVDQVMNELVLPNARSESLAMDSRVFVEDAYLSEVQRTKLTDTRRAELEGELQSRPNSSQVWVEGGQLKSRVVIGNAKGTGYNTQQQAEKLINSVEGLGGMNARAIEGPDGKWFLAAEDNTPLNSSMLSDTQMGDVLREAGAVRANLGKAQRFTDDFVRGTNTFTNRTMQAQSSFQRTLKPFRHAPVSRRANILRVLQTFEGKKDPTNGDLLEHLSPMDAKAARSVLNAGRKAWHMENFRVRGELDFRGFKRYRGVDDGNEAFVRPLEEGSRVPASAKVHDVDGTMGLVSGDKVPAEARLYELAEPAKNGATHFMSLAEDGIEMTELPRRVLNRLPGYIGPRIYNKPFFILKKGEDGRFAAMNTAGSSGSAQKAVDALRAKDPDGEYTFREAREIQADDGSIVRVVDGDVAQQHAAKGTLRTSHRKPEQLRDVEDGELNMAGLEQRLNAMVNSASLGAGVKKWNVFMEDMWNNTYGHLFDGKFSLGKAPIRKEGVAPSDKLAEEAEAVRQYVLSVNNATEAQITAGLQPARNAAADFVASSFRSVANTGSTRIDRGIRNTGDALANNISGLSSGVVNTAKTLTAGAYLFMNAPRMAVMQTTMMFSYMGVDNAFRYMASGRGLRDMMVLTFDGLQRSDHAFNQGRRALAIAAGRSMGMKKSEVHDLLDSFTNSGLRGVADNHIYTLGTITDTHKGMKGSWALDNTSRIVQTSKSMGFDVGVMAETRMAYLVSRNKWMKTNGKAPSSRQELDEVTDMALNLTMNQNSSDKLVGQDGVIGVLTQFMSHQLKMSGRILGTAGKSGEAGMLSPRELRRMAGLQVMGWGFGGLGLSTLVHENFPGLPETAKLALTQGIMGSMANFLMAAATNGDPTTFAFSEEFGPANFIGGYADLVSDVVGHLMDAEFGQAAGSLFSAIPSEAPAGALFQSGMDAVKFSANMMGHWPGTWNERALASATELAKVLPITNSVVKAHAVANRGMAVDSVGTPVIEQAQDSWVMTVLGVDPTDVDSLRNLTEDLHGVYEESDDEALYNGMEEQAKEDVRVYGKKLFDAAAFDNGYEALAELNRFVEANAQRVLAMTGGEKNEAYFTYMDTFRRELRPAGDEEDTKMKTILSRIVSQADQGQLNPAERDPRDIIRESGISSELSNEYIERLDRMYDNKAMQRQLGEQFGNFINGDLKNGY